ncbi:hypothetical protein V6N11_012178 [Hibiscus sabdariffa]|uniref:Retrovirus-related Pol polyprotein from transposon TNT 1-94-like beta-barrel domain-containing protein n=1 Tax=Hibiscus sabdariffa TaxID=183260 RepID=A0ABR2QAF3_9ROSI
MKYLLFVKALHLLVFATQKLDSKSDEEWEFEHQQVCGFIRQFVEENVYNHIDQETHAHTLWEKLLLGMGVKFDDEILGLWLLATLLDSWETFRVSLINSAPHGIITLDLAKSGVLNEEKFHIKKYCFKLKRENKCGGDKHDRNDEEKSERTVITREDLLVICDKNLVNLACNETSWVIDTGASIHVTSRRDFFPSYTPCDFGVLKMGNDDLVSVTRMRDVSLVSNNGTKLILKDVRHAPDIRLNLISAGKLDDEGLKNATLKNCTPCLAGKQRRVSFSSPHPHRKSELLELVHSDVCGPIKTIDDIDKTKKEDSPDSGDLTDVNPVPLDPSSNPIQDDVHGDVNDDHQDICDFDAPIDDVVTDQQQAPIAPPTVPLRRSSRDRRSSVRDFRERKSIDIASVLVRYFWFLP